MYKYEDHKSHIFSDEGQREFLIVRDHVSMLLSRAGAVSMGKAMGVICGDTWTAMSYVDRMVELGEILEISGPNVAGQHRVFVSVTR